MKSITPKRKIYDMLIAGSGAAGGLVAKELTAAGANVLLLNSRYEHPFADSPKEALSI